MAVLDSSSFPTYSLIKNFKWKTQNIMQTKQNKKYLCFLNFFFFKSGMSTNIRIFEYLNILCLEYIFVFEVQIADIINDWRARVAGGMGTALMLWESCVIPTLLYGAGTWVDIPKSTTKKLNNLQRWFVRLILQVGPGAPLTALTRETGLLDMGLRVDIEKVMFIFHLRSLDKDSLASRIYNEQKSKQWPGLADETKKICVRLQIEDVNTTIKSKKDFKKL